MELAAGDRVVVVVANLGTEPLAGMALTSRERVLPAGRYTVRRVAGAAAGAPEPLAIGADGRILGWAPVRSLRPRSAYVLDLTRTFGVRD